MARKIWLQWLMKIMATWNLKIATTTGIERMLAEIERNNGIRK
jgi:hypothetical protein